MTTKELYALSNDITRFTKEPINNDNLSQEQIEQFEKLQTAAKKSSVIRRFTELLNHRLGDSF
jgi:hypothetical protein